MAGRHACSEMGISCASCGSYAATVPRMSSLKGGGQNWADASLAIRQRLCRCRSSGCFHARQAARSRSPWHIGSRASRRSHEGAGSRGKSLTPTATSLWTRTSRRGSQPIWAHGSRITFLVERGRNTSTRPSKAFPIWSSPACWSRVSSAAGAVRSLGRRYSRRRCGCPRRGAQGPADHGVYDPHPSTCGQGCARGQAGYLNTGYSAAQGEGTA